MKKEQLFGLVLIAALIFGGIYFAKKGTFDKVLDGSWFSFSGFKFGGQKATTTTVIAPKPGGASPYAKKIKIESVALGFGGGEHRLVITSYAPKGESIPLSGWTIESNVSTEVIPQVSKIYRENSGESLIDVVLNRGDTLTVSSGLSPVEENIRVNTCMGYLQNRYTFTPSLGVSCYKPTATELSGLSGQCRIAIANLTPCREATTTPSYISASDASCHSFFESLDYEGCVETRSVVASFFTGNWNVWVGVPFLSIPNGSVTLKDAQGRVVSSYSY